MTQPEKSDMDRHHAVVVSSRRVRDGLRLRYWVRCWVCDLRRGPFTTRAEADNCRRHAEEGFR